MENQKDLEVLWTPEQLAEYFTLSKRTIYGWIYNKKVINPDKIIRIGNRVRIPRSEVQRIARKEKKIIQATPIK